MSFELCNDCPTIAWCSLYDVLYHNNLHTSYLANEICIKRCTERAVNEYLLDNEDMALNNGMVTKIASSIGHMLFISNS